MLNKTLFFFFISIVFCSLLNAQTITISKPIPLSSKTSKFKILGKNNIGYWVRNYGKNEERIDVYDENLNLYKSKSLLVKRQNFSTVSFFLGTNNATIYYTEYKKRTMYLYASSINERLETGAEISLDTTKYETFDDAASVSFATSINKSYHMLFVPLYENAQFKKIKIIGTNGGAYSIYNKIIDINKNTYSASPEDAIVNNDGSTLLLIKYKSNINDSILYMTYVLNKKGELTYKTIINFDKNLFGDPYMLYNEKTKAFIINAFTSDMPKEGANYFTTSTLNFDDANESKINHYKIDKQILDDIYEGDAGKITGLYTFKIKKVILTNDNGVYVFTESFFKENKEEISPDILSLSPMNNFQPSFNNTRTVSVYHYNNVLCLKINDSLRTFDYELIKKNQVSENDNGAYSSFSIFNTGKNIKCLYNSEESSIYSLVENTFGENTTNTKQVLLNQEKKGIQLIPKLSVQTSINEIVLPSYRNDDFKLIKIKY